MPSSLYHHSMSVLRGTFVAVGTTNIEGARQLTLDGELTQRSAVYNSDAHKEISTLLKRTMSSLATYSTTASVTYHRGGALNIPGLSLVHDGGRVLFNTSDDISLRHGTIIGLVGTNGAGKTSLARVLASKELPGFPQNMVIEYLAASDDEEYLAGRSSSTSANADEMEMKSIEYIQLRLRQRSEQLLDEISTLEEKLEGADVDYVEDISNQLAELYDIEESLNERVQREMHEAIDELGLDQFANRPLSQLSSGWRYKTRLVSAFLTHPDFLIIDEPSFLDEASTHWFVSRTMESAKTDKAIVLLISHKEAMLETLCDNILYINSGNQTATMYHCGYNIFRSTHQEQVQHATKTIEGTESKHQSAEKSLKKLQADLKGREKNLKKVTSENSDQRFIKGKNKEAKQKADKSAASKLKRTKKQVEDLAEARRRARTERVKPIHIDGTPSDGKIVSLEEVAAAYDNNHVFENVDASVEATDRILLFGCNGVGKSTLTKVILGEMEPCRGNISRRTGNFIYFPQTALSDMLRRHGDATAIQFLGEHIHSETQARNHLGNFGLAKDLALRHVNTLSAGQRVRLWLAKETLLHPNPALLIVDEISENVDRETRDSLVQLLGTFEAAVVCISHDPDFRQSFKPTKTWELRRYGMRERYID